MPALANIQQAMRQAIVAGVTSHLDTLLVGGKIPTKRLAIHRRHYEASLVKAMLEKFPATTWLVGSAYLSDAARQYIREYPPQDPCIAVYGVTFPQYLALCPGSDRLPYLQAFAELEWHVGQVSIAVDYPAIPIEELAAVGMDNLPETTLNLQPGTRYLHAGWPVDELMRYFLTDTAPEQVEFEPSDLWLEVRGARGEFHINRLEEGNFLFRREISYGHSVGVAAERALEFDKGFDPGRALAAIFAAGLVTKTSLAK
ncbi:MAG: putative DNA-binding domain-containing protein [Acidobacteria bacterium]|nr:putative DNA-binding domain-containing protein [Acidobacteriota bacterium]